MSFTTDLHRVTADLLMEHGLTAEQADTRVYVREIPSDRDRVIYEAWRAGTPPRELARRHGLALTTISNYSAATPHNTRSRQ